MSKTPKSVQIRVSQKSNKYLTRALREMQKVNPYACKADAVQALINFRELHLHMEIKALETINP